MRIASLAILLLAPVCCALLPLVGAGALAGIGAWLADGAWPWLISVPVAAGVGVFLWRRARIRRVGRKQALIRETE